MAAYGSKNMFSENFLQNAFIEVGSFHILQLIKRFFENSFLKTLLLC